MDLKLFLVTEGRKTKFFIFNSPILFLISFEIII